MQKTLRIITATAALCASLLCSQAHASAVAVMAGAAAASNSASNEVPNPPVLMIGNDGYTTVQAWYKDGPEIRVCVSKIPRTGALKVKGKTCYAKVRDTSGMFSELKTVNIGEGVPLQEFLDKEYGSGKTTFVGVSPLRTQLGSDLIVFYRINR